MGNNRWRHKRCCRLPPLHKMLLQLPLHKIITAAVLLVIINIFTNKCKWGLPFRPLVKPHSKCRLSDIPSPMFCHLCNKHNNKQLPPFLYSSNKLRTQQQQILLLEEVAPPGHHSLQRHLVEEQRHFERFAKKSVMWWSHIKTLMV